MNLEKMMRMVGIGCGKHCRCASTFVQSLDDEQREMLADMIERGAEKHLELMMDASREDSPSCQKETSSGLVEKMLQSAFGKNIQINAQADPYEGKLGDELSNALVRLPEHERKEVERDVRSIIAIFTDNDPTRVKINFMDDNWAVMLRENETRAEENSDTPSPEEAVS